MATQQNLVAQLKGLASIEPTETVLIENQDEVLRILMDNALLEHNPSLSYSALPANQELMVILLAWIGVCHVRAGSTTNSANLSGASGYGQDRQTPYDKNLALIPSLRKRYENMASKLGLNTSVQPNTVSVSEIIVKSPTTDIGTPLQADTLVLPAPVLYKTAESTTENSVTFGFFFDDIPNVYEFRVYHTSGTTPEEIYQAWNAGSTTGIPYLNPNATLLSPKIDVPSARNVKVQNLDLTTSNRFFLLAVAYGPRYGYSSELLVGPITGASANPTASPEVVVL